MFRTAMQPSMGLRKEVVEERGALGLSYSHSSEQEIPCFTASQDTPHVKLKVGNPCHPERHVGRSCLLDHKLIIIALLNCKVIK